jgi:hypothetical protein
VTTAVAGPTADLALSIEDVLTPIERRVLADAQREEVALVSRINTVAGTLHALYRGRQLGLGPDPAWSAEVSARQREMDDLYAALRAARATQYSILMRAAERLRGVRRANPAARHFDAC